MFTSNHLKLSELAKSMRVPVHKLLENLKIKNRLIPTSKGDYLIHCTDACVLTHKFHQLLNVKGV